MKKSKRLLALFLSLVFALSPAFISPAYTADDDVSRTIMSEELQMLENSCNDKYNKLLEYWAYDPAIIDDTNANFPSFYGGIYINEQKSLVIQVTCLNDAVKAYFGNIIDLSNVVFEEVKYSYEDLKVAHSEIVEKMDPESSDDIISSISGVGISFPENSVNLHIKMPIYRADTEAFRNEICEKISSFENLKIVPTSGMDRVCYDVEPGSELSTGIYHMSAGFWAYNQHEDLGIITAAHSYIEEGDTVYFDSEEFGVAETPYFGWYLDAVFVRCTNPDITPTNYISDLDFYLKSTYRNFAVGSIVYTKGARGGCSFGAVTDTNYSTAYGVHDCVVINGKSYPGDSGGIVAGGGDWDSRYVAGIITGSTFNGNTIYVKAGNIIPSLTIAIY